MARATGDSNVLKLDNVPNTMPSTLEGADNDLGGAPNVADQSFWSDRRDGDRSTHFIIWPAHVGERPVNVRISTRELSRISDDDFEINSVKITVALQRHRERIEQRANEMLKRKPDATEITLDLDSLG
jgi:hypothetical protein